MGLDTQKIQSQNTISRYDLARLLNIVECKDCINPNQDMISKYVENFWSAFSSWKDFNDIKYLGGIYNSASYYYCVAYVGDNTYMRWYPLATSPVCGGKFCGSQNTTTAEFIQVVINILAKYIYKDISLNRKQVNTRVKKQKIDSYEAKNFSTDDKKTINEKSLSCENTCTLQNSNEVNLYLKYCMFNIAACSMQEVGKIKQWSWPVAELNLLYSQNIINIDQTQRKDTNKNIDGKTVLETLFKLNGKISCAFNNDYDCDGRDNPNDNCPNTYNPSQKDTDQDNIWDVCDDDIDGDGIKNAVGIIDEEEKIDIAKRNATTDNCLWTKNTTQEDTNLNGIGDTCEKTNEQLGIYINIGEIKGSAPVTTTFTAVTQWSVREVQRDFGDETQGTWAIITHTFSTPGMYNVQAKAIWATTQAKAQIIVIIGGTIGDQNTLQTRASMIGWWLNTQSLLSASSLGDADEIQRTFSRENISNKKPINESFQKLFSQSGQHLVLAKAYTKGKLTAVSAFTIGIDNGKWAILRSNISNPEIKEKILFDTKTYNIRQDDIVNVNRDFGEGNKINNTTLTMEYAYTTAGKKAVTQTITCTDGTTLTNIITLQVTDKTTLWSYALRMIPSTLIANIGQKITFTSDIIGNMMGNPLTQIAEFADGTIQQKPWTEKLPSVFIHAYQKNGSLTPQDSIYINQCTYLKTQATIAIKWIDSCLDAKIQGKLKESYKCDLDGDAVPDICDTDIDGDGVINLLGLINTETKNCAYSRENLNQAVLIKHFQSICSLDNAPFNSNADQLDLNQDGIGDVYQETIWIVGSGEIIDTDNDSIPDNQDICPTIQETRNNITDEDGCPEIWTELWCKQTIAGITNDTLRIQAECNQCPCPFWDVASDLTNNDQVRAVLRNKEKTIQYKFSLPWIVDF